MATYLGLTTKAGMKVQAAFGTPIAVGAGDRLALQEISVKDGAKRELLADEISKGDQTPVYSMEQPVITLKLLPTWHGADIAFASLMGLQLTATQKSTLIAAKRRQYCIPTSHGSPAYAFTLAWSHDGTTVYEASDLMVRKITLKVAGGKVADLQAECLCRTIIDDSATNTSTQITNLTYPFTRGEQTLMHHLHGTLKVAQTEGTLAELQVTDYTLEANNGLSDDNFTTQNSSGGFWSQPETDKHWAVQLKFTPHKLTTPIWLQRWQEGNRLKATLEIVDSNANFDGGRGCRGVSKSGTNPSIDLSGHASPGTFKVTIEPAKQQTVSVVTTTLNSGALIAAAIQAAIRALTPGNLALARRYTEATFTYTGAPATDYYTLTVGGYDGDDSSAVIVDGVSNDIAAELKIGVANGGTEVAGESNRIKAFLPDLEMVDAPDLMAQKGAGVVRPEMTFKANLQYGTTAPTGFADADDDYLTSDMSEEEIRFSITNMRTTDILA